MAIPMQTKTFNPPQCLAQRQIDAAGLRGEVFFCKHPEGNACTNYRFDFGGQKVCGGSPFYSMKDDDASALRQAIRK